MNTTGKKYGGRTAGTPNKLTKELRSVLKNIVYYQLEELEEQFKQLPSKDRIELLIKLMPYILPKVNEIHYNNDEPIEFSFE
jgi:hypothetical protein